MELVKPNKKGISLAALVLRQGGVVVYPTDTAYALGAIFNSKKAIKKILKIKKRNDEKFTLIASSLSQVKKFFKLNNFQSKIAKKFWPAPFSIVVSEKFAVRVPAEKISRKLAELAGRPLIATSANLTGKKTLYDSKAIIRQFEKQKNQPDLIIDSGALKKIKTSTIVRFKDNQVEVIRPGAVNLKITNNNSK